MLHCVSPTVGWWPTENKQAELVGKGGELSKAQERAWALAGKLTMWTAARAASGKVLTPSCARGKGGLTPSEGVRPQFCKARCSLYGFQGKVLFRVHMVVPVIVRIAGAEAA